MRFPNEFQNVVRKKDEVLERQRMLLFHMADLKDENNGLRANVTELIKSRLECLLRNRELGERASKFEGELVSMKLANETMAKRWIQLCDQKRDAMVRFLSGYWRR